MALRAIGWVLLFFLLTNGEKYDTIKEKGVIGLAKKKEGFKPVKQISDIREREAHINIDYYSNTCKLYTNHATTINRLAKKGILPNNTTTLNGLAYGASYSVPLEDMKIFLQVGLYK